MTKPNLKFQTEKDWEQKEIPDGASIQPDGWILFKQTKDLFKQLQDPETGHVIGLMYRGPRMDGFTTMSLAQVRSRRNIYAKRADAGEVSEAVGHALDVWDWALRLFYQNRPVQAPNLKTIHQPEEAVAP